MVVVDSVFCVVFVGDFDAVSVALIFVVGGDVVGFAVGVVTAAVVSVTVNAVGFICCRHRSRHFQ